MGLLRKRFLFILVVGFQINVTAGNKIPQINTIQVQWADSILATMSINEKIGQLMMLPVYSNANEKYYQDIEMLIRNYHIGNLLFFQGTPVKQLLLTQRFQEIPKIPLFIGADAEIGLSMRLDSINALPKNMTMGALTDDKLVYNMGAEIARQCQIMGIQINFAPVLDVNNNPANPVINMRSFGENPEKVSKMGLAYLQGLQDNGIIAVGKHFPGHGDTNTDSHYALPVIRHNLSRLDSIELIPFANAIKQGISGIMVAHLNIPALESRPDIPSTLSEAIVRNTLIDKMNFKNLIFTDAMNMKGVASNFTNGKGELMAFKAGNDIIVMPVNIQEVFQEFKRALRNKEISEDDIDERVHKILKFKYQSGLKNIPELNDKDLTSRINKNIPVLNQQIFENAITLIQNKNNLIPIHMADTMDFASLSIYENHPDEFQESLNLYADFEHYSFIKNELTRNKYQELIKKLSKYEMVVVGVHTISNNPKYNFGIKMDDLNFLKKLNQQTNVILVLFGNPYSSGLFQEFNNLVCAYENNSYSKFIVPQQLFGAIAFKGRLPVTASENFREGHGIDTNPLGRLGLSDPENLGFNKYILSYIDTIVEESIHEKVMPGCQILIAKRGRIIWNKNYGYYTYDSLISIRRNSVYDLASISKVAGTIQILMILVEKNLIDIDKKLSHYLPDLKNTNKEDLIIRDILAHQSGLIPYYPYWKTTLNGDQKKYNYYNSNRSEDHSIELSTGLYVKPALKDTLWNWMIQSDLRRKENVLIPYDYKYSDIGFYLIQKLIEEVTGWPLNVFLDEYLYKPIGARTITYLPKNKFTLERIVPTEIDRTFRKGLIQGNVHDEIASIYGGVAGHAGVFSNAYDLAIILQMNLQNGIYGGTRYIHPTIVHEFTRRQYDSNRRGLGWDKTQKIGDEYNPATYLASDLSYGHSGFTGTYSWVDPENDLIYIFLSNRTYPDSDNKKLIDLEVRKRIQTVIYSSLINN